MKDKKMKIKKAAAARTHKSEEEYPEEINPFGSSEKVSKNGKVKFTKKNKKDKQPEQEIQNSDGNPFEEDKKKEKKEQKLLKKELKKQKKEAKKKQKNGVSDANGNKVAATEKKQKRTPIVKKVVKIKKYNKEETGVVEDENLMHKADKTFRQGEGSTDSNPPATSNKRFANDSLHLNHATPATQVGASSVGTMGLTKAPQKRVLQLKADTLQPRLSPSSPPLSDLTCEIDSRTRPCTFTQSRSVDNLTTEDLESSDAKVTVRLRESAHECIPARPLSLEVPRSNVCSSSNTLSPLTEEKTPSPLNSLKLGHNKDMRMYRTSSVSKKGKEKKKFRILAKRLKKKKKTKRGKETTLLEEHDVTSQVVLRHPRVNLQALQNEVDEVRESARSSIINLVEQRNSALDKLTENTRELEEFSLGFARIAQETRLKKQAQASCCGIGSRWKVCWYICACEGRLGRKKKKTNDKTSTGDIPASMDLLNDDDQDDYYRPAHTTETKLVETEKLSHRSSAGKNSNLISSSVADLSSSPRIDCDRVGDSGTFSRRNKFFRVPKALRASMPMLADTDSLQSGSLRSMAEIDPRERKSSSVNAIHEIVKKRGEKKRRQKQEKDIAKFASQYDDDDTRKRVKDLLRLDM